jgi:vancomycin resistance protein YoaR
VADSDTTTGADSAPPATGAMTMGGQVRRRPPTALLASGAIVGGLALILLVIMLVRAGAAMPGTHIEGVPVGGMGAEDLRAVVQDLVLERQQATVPVMAADQPFEFVPGSDGYGADVDATVADALRAGRESAFGIVEHVRATFGTTRDVRLHATPLNDAIEAFVADVAGIVNQAMEVGSVRVDPTSLLVDTTAPQDRVVLDRDGSIAALRAVVGSPSPPMVLLPAQVDAPPTDDDALADAVARAERAVAEPLTLRAPGGDLTLEPDQIARVLRTREFDGRLVLVADPDELAAIFEPHLPDLEVDPRSARFELVSSTERFDTQGNATWSQRPAEVRVIPGTDGHLFDAEEVAPRVGALLEAGVRDGELEFVVTPPDLTTQDAEELGITHLIGTFTTYHACCANRVTNIQRMADLVRGSILKPGDEFSINDHVGQRTRAKGFVEDGAIFQGEIRPELGGGVSQFATTMYNAAFFSGIEILQHRAHSLYISRYPLGREATLNYPSIDLRIRNNTDNGIFIHTSYTSTSITVSLYGNNGGRTVSAVMGDPYNFRDYSTRRRDNNNLPSGRERTVQSGQQGYQVTVQRVIRGGGIDRTERITTTYQPRPEVIEVGTGPSPSPSPSPSPTPTDSPSPTSPPPDDNGDDDNGDDDTPDDGD